MGFFAYCVGSMARTAGVKKGGLSLLQYEQLIKE